MLRYSAVVLLISFLLGACNKEPVKTTVAIKGDQFYINDQITYAGRDWEGHKIEGLLFNARLVQGIFDDLNPETKKNFKYPDTDVWDPERNTNEFVAAMQSWKDHGLLAFTLNLQGGSPLGYGNHGWHNSTFDENGNLRPAYIERLTKILDQAEELNMVVILGYFYFGQDQFLKDETAVINAVDNMTRWLIEKGYNNLLIEANNECDIFYDHDILKEERISEIILRIRQKSNGKLLVSTSFSGGKIPTAAVVAHADYVLLHGNGVEDPMRIRAMVDSTRALTTYNGQPIVFNEDDHFDFDKKEYNLKAAISNYASWGYFDFRMEGESFENGFQSVPVDWTISSKRKKEFFGKLKEITGQ